MDAVVYRARVEGVLSGEDMVGMRLRLDCFVCCGGGYWPLISANDHNNERSGCARKLQWQHWLSWMISGAGSCAEVWVWVRVTGACVRVCV